MAIDQDIEDEFASYTDKEIEELAEFAEEVEFPEKISKIDNKKSAAFENFDVLPNVAEDHHFLKNNKSGTVTDSTSLNIQKEWRILQRNLPRSIYVRVYEPRIDLLRAVIVGPPGTPYHDGLFFFDIFLPSDYPNRPPKVYYHSHGYRLNPNLYKSGYVCLSLINTWFGERVEKWSGKQSTILQLLVSIEGLVLNERPYFNEPGYAHGKDNPSATWIDASISYNEDVFVLSCKTMIQIMKNPPEGFEDLVLNHFRERSFSILSAVEAYQEGRVLCGQYFQLDGKTSSSSSTFSTSRSVYGSTKFKDNLKSIRETLADSFMKVYSEDVTKGQWEEAKKIALKEKMEAESKKGLFAKLIGLFLAGCLVLIFVNLI